MRRGMAVLISTVLTAAAGYPCSIFRAPNTDMAAEVVRGAEVIVRATAAEYAIPPDAGHFGTIRLKVVEVIRGKPLSELTLFGELIDQDDFNRGPSPYQGPRPSGLAGSCYAFLYRPGAHYPLMLKKDAQGKLTPDWYPISPVNEQLHGDDNPWLIWVRQQVKR